mmetsp:Transcript_8351/g.18181  ORF Transcript_8351/g.18181 Transcript_8351/m.18181 type:complete len:467 (+) Transcript_8351:110-1510(+)
MNILLSCIALVLGHYSSPVEAFSTSTSSTTNNPLQWLIVGGGPHGVHIATRLLEEVPSISRSDLCIVDEEPRLLHKWKTRTAATGMAYLRSSASYHLDVREDGLKRFAHAVEGTATKRSKQKRQSISSTLFASDYQRPRLDFFNEHCDHVVRKNELDRAHVQGTVTDVVPNENHVEVEIEKPNGDIVTAYAKNVVLALGNAPPVVPDWANDEMIHAGKIKHIFDEGVGLDFHASARNRSIAIVGGGISAAHLALKLEREAGARSTTAVHLVCRHDLREQQFDTHQDWMMDSAAAARSEAGGGQGLPKCRRHFASLDSYAERRDVIKRERVAGTVSASVSRGEGGLRYAMGENRIRWHREVVRSVTQEEAGGGKLTLWMPSGDSITVDQIILATGFGKDPPARHLINSIAQRNGLKLCDCGYPAPDESLRWHKRIFLAGALAELELGPSARNIAGARLSSERIVAAA